MRKGLTIAAIIFLFAVTPALAESARDHDADNHGNSQNAQANHHENINTQDTVTITTKHEDKDDQTNPTSSPAISQTITPSVSPCDPSLNWKNHGAYVSCVAHFHGDVDDAARSDIGKKHNPTGTPVPTISVTPSETVTPTPSVSPVPSASPTPSVSVSPTPVSSAMDTVFDGEVPFQNLGALIGRFVTFLVHLI